MNSGLYRAASAMVGHQQRLDAISANLANVGTTGYKRNSTALHQFLVPRSEGPIRGQVLRTQTDFGQGNLVTSPHEYDLALSGEGFFTVDGPDGELYTRDGSFEIDPEGVLMSRMGMPVTWETKISAIDPTGMPVVVDSSGVVFQDDLEIGRLRLANFENTEGLRMVGGGYWTAPPDLRETTPTATVHQYSLEESNSSGTEEIIAMIGVQRAFESTANLVQSIERSYSRLTRSA